MVAGRSQFWGMYGVISMPHNRTGSPVLGKFCLIRASNTGAWISGLGFLFAGQNQTFGDKETRAWTIKKGFTGPQAAGVIHTDFERGFIRAEVYSLEDLESYESEAAIRQNGKLRVEGKSYVVQDGDICHFLFNV